MPFDLRMAILVALRTPKGLTYLKVNNFDNMNWDVCPEWT